MSVTREFDEAVDPDLLELIDAVLADGSSVAAEGSVQVDHALWSALDEAGLSKITGAGEFGSGASWREAAELLRAAGRHAALLPLAENDLLAGWLAERAGLPDSRLMRTSAVVDSDGVARGVPWGRAAASIVLLQRRGPRWSVRECLVSDADVVEERRNLAGEPRDALRVGAESDEAVRVEEAVAAEWWLRGALARAVQIAGALERAVDIAVQYSSERQQFGRPIGGFQAVQHLAATMASETSLVLAATDRAVVTAAAAADWADPQVEFDIAVAKSCASAAASVVTRAAHQILGAIGTTSEHRLHTVTLPALAWATEFGTADAWNARIVDLVAGPDRRVEAWEMITGVRTPTA